MNRKLKIFTIAPVLSILVSGYSLNLNPDKTKYVDEDTAYYLTDKTYDTDTVTTVMKDDKEISTKLKKLDETSFKKIKNDSIKTIWIEEDKLKDADIKDKLGKLYNEHNKIVIRGEDITKEEALNYVGVTDVKLDFVETIDPKLKRTGVLIEKVGDNSFNISGINVEEYNNEDSIKSAMLYTSKSKLNEELRGNNSKKSTDSIVKKNLAYADWVSCGASSNVDSWTLVNVGWSMEIKKDTGSSYYKSSNKIVVDAARKSTKYKIDYTVLSESSSVAGYSILDFSPDDSPAPTQSITLGFPWSTSGTIDVTPSVSIQRILGGVGTNGVAIQFSSSSPGSTMKSAISVEARQDASNYNQLFQYQVNLDGGLLYSDVTASAQHTVSGS